MATEIRAISQGNAPKLLLWPWAFMRTEAEGHFGIIRQKLDEVSKSQTQMIYDRSGSTPTARR
jgi:hypothetical protein